MWNKIPFWLKGGLISVLYLGVIIPLSSFCPSEGSECFTDIFEKIIFLPLVIFKSLFPEMKILNPASALAFLFSFWFCFGTIYGLMFGFYKKDMHKSAKKIAVKKDFEDEVPKPPAISN